MTKEHIYKVEGMHCASCEILIEKKDVIELATKYIELLAIVVSDTIMVVTPEAFERLEANKRELSKLAEEYVLESEQERLKNKGGLPARLI